MNYRLQPWMAMLAGLALTIVSVDTDQSLLLAQRPGFGSRSSAARRPAFSQRGVGLGARSVTLQEALEKGLKARRPEEFAFLERVTELVDAKKLPLELVQSTFDWAREKRPFPYPYFERALKVRAARVGISVK